jgi:hypothetical protein
VILPADRDAGSPRRPRELGRRVPDVRPDEDRRARRAAREPRARAVRDEVGRGRSGDVGETQVPELAPGRAAAPDAQPAVRLRGDDEHRVAAAIEHGERGLAADRDRPQQRRVGERLEGGVCGQVPPWRRRERGERPRALDPEEPAGRRPRRRERRGRRREQDHEIEVAVPVHVERARPEDVVVPDAGREPGRRIAPLVDGAADLVKRQDYRRE